MIQKLYIHRRFLFGSFWADFRFRYAGTALGFFWFIVTPLLEAILYSIVFSYLIGMRSGGSRGVSYTLFLLAGLFPWFAFSHIITRGSNALNSAALYLRRLAIPSEIFIAREALNAMFSLLIYFVILIPINLILGNPLSWHILATPVLIFLFIGMGYGISLALAYLRVLFPDLGEVLSVLVQLWRWTLPVNYSYEIFPEHLRGILTYNPPYYYIVSFRDLFIEKQLPTPIAWLHMIGWMVIFGLIGSFISSRLETEVKDQM